MKVETSIATSIPDAYLCPWCGGEQLTSTPVGELIGDHDLSCQDCGLLIGIRCSLGQPQLGIAETEWGLLFPND